MVSVAWGETMPQTTAAHFCQLLVKTNEGRLMSLHAFIRQTPAASDSLTIEQQFADYVFHYGGWQSLRIFPHQQADPRHLQSLYGYGGALRHGRVLETGNWETVDEYTDRLLQYQRTFSATTPIRQAGGSTTTILAGFLLLLFIASARTSCSGRSRG